MAEKSSLDDLKIDRSGVSDSPSGSWMWVLLLLPLAVIAGLAYWLMQPEGKTVVVVVARVTSLEGGQTVLNASGYVTARRMAVVSSKVTAKVLEVLIDEGMEVREGQVLARLDASNVERSLRLAEAQLASAKSVLAETKALLAEAKLRLGRTRALVKDEVLSQAQLDAVQAETDGLSRSAARTPG